MVFSGIQIAGVVFVLVMCLYKMRDLWKITYNILKLKQNS